MSWTADKTLLLCLILVSAAAAARADDIDWAKWKELSAINQQRQQEISQIYVPAKMDPTDSEEGVFQQVLNYQVQQARMNGLPIRVFAQKWNGTMGNPTAETKQNTYEMRPFETRGSINFSNGVRASVRYDIGAREMEYKIVPLKFHGWDIAISHIDTPIDQRSKFMFGRNW